MSCLRTRHNRISAAGYSYVSGWLPDHIADQVQKMLTDHADDIERAAATAPKRGRRPKQDRQDG
jgi:hypothetical protein